MNVELRPIAGYEGYAATADGHIWRIGSLWRGLGDRRMGEVIDKSGYRRVRIRRDGRVILTPVHRLVCIAFHGSPAPGDQTRHLNGDRLDCRAANLAWGSAAENAADRRAHGRDTIGDRNGLRQHPERAARGERHWCARLTTDDVLAIRAAAALRVPYEVLATRYSCGYENVSAIVRRKSWRHLTDAPT
jgi:hypothetical protein